jgi:glycosyltransferase involved in cell wall biosynthesis
MPLRILHLIESASSNGGAERFAIGLAMNLPRDRFESWLCTTRDDEEAAIEMVREAQIPHVNLGRRTKWDVHRLAGLATLLRREHFDILHTHMFGSNVWGALIGSACRVPVIVAHEHSWSYEGEPLRAWLDGRVVGRLATRFVAVSSADGRRMATRERVPIDKIVVMPNGYVPSPTETDGDFRAELGLSPHTPLIATAAILRPEKRVDLVIEAHARVVGSIPDAHLAIAGDGECRGELEHQARALGLNGLVHFLGMRSDVDSILRAADVAASGSDREGSPLLMFECMASGTPLVATDVGGLRDVVEDGRTGLLVPRRDVNALAGGVVALLSDPARRTEIAAAARAQLPQFTMEATVQRFVALYEALAQAVRRGHRTTP